MIIWIYFWLSCKNNKEDLLFFISEEELNKKINLVKNWPKRITVREALDLLYKDTNNEKYKEFSLKILKFFANGNAKIFNKTNKKYF